MQKLKDLLRREGILAPEDFTDVVLRAAYKRSLAEPPGYAISAGSIAAVVEASEKEVIEAIERLAEEGFVDAAFLRGGGSGMPLDAMVRDIKPDGLRQLGVWPA